MPLIDTNVIVAALVRDHPHHAHSARLLNEGEELHAAAHSLAEAYNTLTRTGRGYGFASGTAIRALDTAIARIAQLELTAVQTLTAIRRFAREGGRGPRVYDALIGEHARAHAIAAIVTWNIGDMAALFPDLAVVTPAELAPAG